jgi:hypothetical protein
MFHKTLVLHSEYLVSKFWTYMLNPFIIFLAIVVFLFHRCFSRLSPQNMHICHFSLNWDISSTEIYPQLRYILNWDILNWVATDLGYSMYIHHLNTGHPDGLSEIIRRLWHVHKVAERCGSLNDLSVECHLSLRTRSKVQETTDLRSKYTGKGRNNQEGRYCNAGGGLEVNNRSIFRSQKIAGKKRHDSIQTAPTPFRQGESVNDFTSNRMRARHRSVHVFPGRSRSVDR